MISLSEGARLTTRSDADSNDVPPLRLTPAKRARTAAQERAARDKALGVDAPVTEEPKKVPVKRATKKLTAKRPIVSAPSLSVAETPVAETPVSVEAPVVTPTPEMPKVDPAKVVVALAPPTRAPSPLDNLPAPRPGVPITKTHVFGVLGALVLLVRRRRRKKKR